MTPVLGLAPSWREAYTDDDAFFVGLRAHLESCAWVSIPFAPSLDQLAGISSWDMRILLDKWKSQAGPAPNWEELLALRLAEPPGYPISPAQGPRAVRDALNLLESHPGGTTIPPEAVGLDIVPFVPWTGCEAVYPLEVAGRTRLLYAATWPIWSWTLRSEGSRAYLLRALGTSLEEDMTRADVYETALVALCCQVITHRLPVRFTWVA
jgi:hypothetical protein